MTEEKAHAMVGKRARILNSSYDVPPRTEGTVISAMRTIVVGPHIAVGPGGQTADVTARDWQWANNMECDDVPKTVIQIYAWDDSIEVL